MKQATFSRVSLLALVATTAVLLSSRAVAQTALALPKITDVNFFGRAGVPLRSESVSRALSYGYGMETSFDAGTVAADRIRIEFAVGFDQISRFKLSDAGSRLYASVRSLPTFAIYGTLQDFAIAPYVGLQSSLLKFSGTLYDAENMGVSASAEAVGIGLALGVVVPFGLFVEAAYKINYFPAIELKPLNGQKTLPDSLPRKLDLSGIYLTLGIQFDISSMSVTPKP